MTLISIPTPPPRTTPDSFYNTYVPTAWTQFFGDTPPSFDLTIAVDLMPKSSLAICWQRGRLTHHAKGAATITWRSDVTAWRAFALDLWPRILRTLAPRLDALRASLLAFAATHDLDRMVAELQHLPGLLRVRYVDDAGDELGCELQVGSGDGPVAEVVVRETDLWPLIRGETTLARLVKSRITLTGDPGYLLRLLAATALHRT